MVYLQRIDRSFIAVRSELECTNSIKCRYAKMKHHQQPFVLIKLLTSIKQLNLMDKISKISNNNINNNNNNENDIEMSDDNNNNNNNNNNNHCYQAFLKTLICLKHSEWMSTAKLSKKATKCMEFWNKNYNLKLDEFSLNESELVEKFSKLLHQIIIEKSDSNLK